MSDVMAHGVPTPCAPPRVEFRPIGEDRTMYMVLAQGMSHGPDLITPIGTIDLAALRRLLDGVDVS
ncbi:hypothetical protein JCM25156A_32050 [Komagataeibacter kakiaceti JCM 25156]